MSTVKTAGGRKIEVDRDYAGAIGEDVELKVDAERTLLSPDEADELAEWLKYHAEEVRTINKENGLA